MHNINVHKSSHTCTHILQGLGVLASWQYYYGPGWHTVVELISPSPFMATALLKVKRMAAADDCLSLSFNDKQVFAFFSLMVYLQHWRGWNQYDCFIGSPGVNLGLNLLMVSDFQWKPANIMGWANRDREMLPIFIFQLRTENRELALK